MASGQKRKAYSYIRMSTETQLKGHSLTRQLDATSKYAKHHNLKLVDDLRDIGLSAYSGKNIKSGSFGTFLGAIKEGKIEKNSVLLVESFDRLSRMTVLNAFAQFTEILNAGIEIHTLADGQVYSAESVNLNPGQLFSSIGYMLRANSESEEKSRRLKKVWKYKRENLNSKILTTICPAWLESKSDKTGFKIKEAEASTIKKIFDLCIDQDMGAYAIARYLNQNIEKYPKFTLAEKRNRLANGLSKNGWQKSYIIKILNNSAVHGEFQPFETVDGKRVATDTAYINYFPTIVSKQKFNLAQKKMRDRLQRKGGRKGGFNNIFTKLIICGGCGASVHYLNKGLGSKGGRYLRCSNAHLGHSCKQLAWKYDEFEKIIFKFITEIDWQSVFSDRGSDIKLLHNELISTEGEIKKKNDQAMKVLEIQLDLDENYRKIVSAKLLSLSQEISELEEKKLGLEEKIAFLSSQNLVQKKSDLLEEINGLINSKTDEEVVLFKRRIHSELSSLIKTIKVYSASEDFNVWEVNDMLSPSSIKALEVLKVISSDDKGEIRERKIEAYFNNSNGKYLFNDMERHLVVLFSNNEEKRVYPYRDDAVKFNNSRFFKFSENVKKKSENEMINKTVRKLRKKQSKD